MASPERAAAAVPARRRSPRSCASRSCRTALTALLLAAAGWAAPPENLELRKAQTYIDLGTELFAGRDYSGALAEFQRAEPLAPTPRDRAAVRYNIARCLEELGRLEEAVEAFERYLEAPDDARTARQAKRKVRALARKVFGRLTVTCAGGEVSLGNDLPAQSCPARWTRLRAGDYTATVRSGGFEAVHSVVVLAGKDAKLAAELPGGIEVTSTVPGHARLDERDLGATPVRTQTLTPGVYRVEVRAAEHTTWHGQVEVRAGELTTVGAAPIPILVFPDVAEPYLRYSTAGLSVAALLGGAVLLSVADDEADDLDLLLAQYDDASTPEDAGRLRKQAEAAEDDARIHRAVGYTLMGVGAALGGAATWLFLRDGARTSASLSPGGGSVVVRF